MLNKTQDCFARRTSPLLTSASLDECHDYHNGDQGDECNGDVAGPLSRVTVTRIGTANIVSSTEASNQHDAFAANRRVDGASAARARELPRMSPAGHCAATHATSSVTHSPTACATSTSPPFATRPPARRGGRE